MVGGRDFDESHFNRAMQAKRQPGSAFKPFVYAAALEAGYSPATRHHQSQRSDRDAAGRLDARGRALDRRLDDAAHGAADVEQSRGRAAAATRSASRRRSSYAQKLDVGTLPSVPSLALGAGEVTLQSLTAAYGAFANGGIVPHAGPDPPRRGPRRHGALSATQGKSQRAVSEATAFLMSSMLADVINAGTAYRARQTGFTLPAAGKTGTTNDYDDAWFVGFTPTLVTGVWVGFDQPQTIIAQRLRRRARRAAVGRAS